MIPQELKDVDSSVTALHIQAGLGKFSSLLQASMGMWAWEKGDVEPPQWPVWWCLDGSSVVGEVDLCPVLRHVTFFRRLTKRSCQLLASTLSSNPLWRRASLWADVCL